MARKKTFTANFAQSAENNADPVFIKSGIINGLAHGEYDRKSPKCASRVTVNHFESFWVEN